MLIKTFIMKICVCCSKEKSKYKCPRCDKFYCSANCCVIHKSECIVSIDSEKTKIDIAENNQTNDIFEDSIINQSQIESLNNSVWLKKILRSKRLQKTIIDIDSSTNRPKKMKSCRQSNAEFESFVVQLQREIEISVNVKK